MPAPRTPRVAALVLALAAVTLAGLAGPTRAAPLGASSRSAAGVSFGSAAGAASTPPPRVATLRPRVAGLRPRIAGLRPRIVSVAPQHVSPGAISVNTDVLFAFGSAQLSPSAQTVLAGVVAALSHDRPGTVLVTGYTDSVGTAAYNLGLSQRRAAAVRAFLQAHVPNGGLAYRTRGLGEADPVAPNKQPNGADDPAGRQKNRRVVIAYTAAGG